MVLFVKRSMEIFGGRVLARGVDARLVSELGGCGDS